MENHRAPTKIAEAIAADIIVPAALIVHHAGMIFFAAVALATSPIPLAFLILSGGKHGRRELRGLWRVLKSCAWNLAHPFKLSEEQVLRLALRQRRARKRRAG